MLSSFSSYSCSIPSNVFCSLLVCLFLFIYDILIVFICFCFFGFRCVVCFYLWFFCLKFSVPPGPARAFGKYNNEGTFIFGSPVFFSRNLPFQTSLSVIFLCGFVPSTKHVLESVFGVQGFLYSFFFCCFKVVNLVTTDRVQVKKHIAIDNTDHLMSDNIAREFIRTINIMIESKQDKFTKRRYIMSKNNLKKIAQDNLDITLHIKNCVKSYSIRLKEPIDIIEHKYYIKIAKKNVIIIQKK